MREMASNQDDVLDVLTQLVNKSLVLAEREQGQETRYRLLETIRQYALERLAASGEADAIRRRHAGLLPAAGRARGTAPTCVRSRCVWLDRLEVEHDNLRAALAWALGGGDPALGVRLAEARLVIWFMAHGSERARMV